MARTLCPHCQRPQPTCLCHLIQPTANQVELVIWQHPKEVNHPKGSAPLLQLSLAKVHTVIAETLSYEEFLKQCQSSADFAPVTSLEQHQLLSPITEDSQQSTRTSPAADLVTRRLIVIDGTWRKARKIFYLNPWLQQLNPLRLDAVLETRYRIRKAEKPGQYSTLEASCLALGQLEANLDKYQPLIDAFEQQVAMFEKYQR